jgi:hypothetical protein
MESRNEMDTSNDLLWVQEPKHGVILAINEANPTWSFSFPSALMSWIVTKPLHKEKLHVLWFNRVRTRTSIDDSGMEDTNYPPKPIWKFVLGLFFIFVGQRHEVGMRPRV